MPRSIFTALALRISFAIAALPAQPVVHECHGLWDNNHNYSRDAIRDAMPGFYGWLDTQGSKTAQRAVDPGFIADYRTTINGVCISTSIINNNCDYKIDVNGKAMAFMAKSIEEQCDVQNKGPFG